MPETNDPHVALRSKKLSERAAGSRDLGQTGVPDDIPLLVDLARQDRSPGVRLNAAMAAADILSRYRFGSRRKKLKKKQRNELLQLFNGIDPGINPGLFSMLACLGVPEAINRLTVGLRDPRMDIRRGAVVGMR
ncbi:MAG: hypothetical protein QGG40_10200, partial [Myxococcota bacterium]|nr:hypothetical protein [Myxococcota bacterium]